MVPWALAFVKAALMPFPGSHTAFRLLMRQMRRMLVHRDDRGIILPQFNGFCLRHTGPEKWHAPHPGLCVSVPAGPRKKPSAKEWYERRILRRAAKGTRMRPNRTVEGAAVFRYNIENDKRDG